MSNDPYAAVMSAFEFALAGLPEPPARVLEVGAGDGELSRALADAGYDVLAIDPEPRGAGVRAVALRDLDEEPRGSFDAAIAVTSLHHVDPLDDSLRHLAELLAPGGALVVDEFDVGAFDEAAAEWWLRRRRELGAEEQKSAEQLVHEHRSHLHPVERIVAALEPHFRVAAPVYGPYLYRWNLGETFRRDEEAAIERGEIPAVGARFVAQRAR
jgi:SAM-dependent methyltransferase